MGCARGETVRGAGIGDRRASCVRAPLADCADGTERAGLAALTTGTREEGGRKNVLFLDIGFIKEGPEKHKPCRHSPRSSAHSNVAPKMQRTAWGYRPETQSRHGYEPPVHRAYGRHAGYLESEQHTHPRDTVHTVQGMGSTCNYNVYSYHDQHTRRYAEDKYNVYNKYSGDAPGGAMAWQQPQPESAYGSYACHNKSQYARHDGSAWLPTPLAKCGQQNVPDEQDAYTGQYARPDGSPSLPTPLAKCGQQNVPDEQDASGGPCERHDCSSWLATLLAKYGQENVPDEQAARTGQYATHDGSAPL